MASSGDRERANRPNTLLGHPTVKHISQLDYLFPRLSMPELIEQMQHDDPSTIDTANQGGEDIQAKKWYYEKLLSYPLSDIVGYVIDARTYDTLDPSDNLLFANDPEFAEAFPRLLVSYVLHSDGKLEYLGG